MAARKRVIDLVSCSISTCRTTPPLIVSPGFIPISRRLSTTLPRHSVSSHVQKITGLDVGTCEVLAKELEADKYVRRSNVVGRQTAELYLTEILLKRNKNLSCQAILDTVNSVVSGELTATDGAEIADGQKNSMDLMLSLIGTAHLTESKETTNQIMDCMFEPVLSDLDIGLATKLQHPKLMLASIDSQKNVEITSSVNPDQDGSYYAEVKNNGNVIASASHSDATHALKIACVKALRDHFMDDVIAMPLPDDAGSLKLEEEIHLGFDTTSTRTVNVTIDEAGNLGLFLRGGEEVSLRNHDYRHYHGITPVYVCDIVEGGPASKNDQIHIGDTILAINGRSLKGMSHRKVVDILKSYTGKITLSVKYDREAMLRDKFTLDFKKRLKMKFKNSIQAEIWRDWHRAQAKKDPSQYLPFLE